MKIKEFFYSELDRFSMDEIPIDYWFERFRNWRNHELLVSDWTQLPDSSADSAKWAIYRQTLRDLPAIKDFANAELPIRPD